MLSLPWLVFIYLFIWQLQWRSYSILSKKTVSPLLMYFQEWIEEDKSFCGCYQLDTRRKRFTKDKSKSVTLVVQLCSKRWELSNTKTLLKNILAQFHAGKKPQPTHIRQGNTIIKQTRPSKTWFWVHASGTIKRPFTNMI